MGRPRSQSRSYSRSRPDHRPGANCNWQLQLLTHKCMELKMKMKIKQSRGEKLGAASAAHVKEQFLIEFTYITRRMRNVHGKKI